MIRIIIACTLIAVVSTAALAELRTVVRAYEVDLPNFRAPASSTGTAGFRSCKECMPQVLRVSEETRYTVNGEAVVLREFRRALLQASRRERAAVVIMHDVDTDQITAVALQFG